MEFHELEQDKTYKVKGEEMYYMLGDDALKFKPNLERQWAKSGATYNLLISKEYELVIEPGEFITDIDNIGMNKLTTVKMIVELIKKQDRDIKYQTKFSDGTVWEAGFVSGSIVCKFGKGTETEHVGFLSTSFINMCLVWKLVEKPVDFMTAINSGKKIYPIEYFGECDAEELDNEYLTGEDGSRMNDIAEWFSTAVFSEYQMKYINGMWVVGS